MRLLIALALLLLPASAPALAAREMIEIRQGEPVTIRADRAYLLFRTFRPEGVWSIEPVFLRVPTAADLAHYDAARREAFARAEPGLLRRREGQIRDNARAAASGISYRWPVDPLPSLETFPFIPGDLGNLQNIDAGRVFLRGRPESAYLVEVIPGDYVLYGLTYATGTPLLYTCMCLGTVGFTASPGVVTDLGQFLADNVDQPSSIPELRAESGFGPSMNAYRAFLGATVRPATPGLAVPDALRGATIRPADYRAIGKFVDPLAMSINRLVPVPGVLAYDGGRVIDVQSGRTAPDNY